MNTKQNFEKYEKLFFAVPKFLHEKEFAFSEVRPFVFFDLEDYEEKEIKEFNKKAAKDLAYIEKRAQKLGYL